MELHIDPSVAPSIQANALDLKKAQIEDALVHKIDSRPTQDELKARNILPGKLSDKRPGAIC
jgi:hypothetical protein